LGRPGNRRYERVIVTWGATPEAQALAEKHRVQLWDFRDLLRQIAAASKDQRTYFTDDTARTIQLFAMAEEDRSAGPGPTAKPAAEKRKGAR
jgi:hypothetical protein